MAITMGKPNTQHSGSRSKAPQQMSSKKAPCGSPDICAEPADTRSEKATRLDGDNYNCQKPLERLALKGRFRRPRLWVTVFYWDLPLQFTAQLPSSACRGTHIHPL
ncbi:hypothetical protein P7K49_035180 [Saguinus oedipus]|uniref:Uncharacterized protein n=1 Tax=Saguinus oedipus TaxID=9490 RepID=A0ABQ9TXX8_SAGOE|nr:hypothetical protein P7K49_035180 [Saguinus oedipus]